MVIVRFIAATGAYGVIAFLGGWVFLGINPVFVWNTAFSDAGFPSLFAKYLLLSLVPLLIGVIAMILQLILLERKYGIDSSFRMPPAHYIGTVLFYPFQGILGIIGAKTYDTGEDGLLYWGQVIFQFLTSILLIAFICFGLLSLRQ